MENDDKKKNIKIRVSSHSIAKLICKAEKRGVSDAIEIAIEDYARRKNFLPKNYHA